jgi:hypothetical protein
LSLGAQVFVGRSFSGGGQNIFGGVVVGRLRALPAEVAWLDLTFQARAKSAGVLARGEVMAANGRLRPAGDNYIPLSAYHSNCWPVSMSDSVNTVIS